MAASVRIDTFKGWDQFAAATDPKRFRQALAKEMFKATTKSCNEIRDEIAKSIMGKGKVYEKNSGLTILFKRTSTPLIGGNFGIGPEMGGGTDPGATMYKSLGIDAKTYEGFIGVVRNRGGFNVAYIVHEGATLRITEKRRKWLAAAIASAMGKQGKDFSRKGQAFTVDMNGKEKRIPSAKGSNNVGSAIIIPPRPFIRHVMQDPALQRRVIDRWGMAAAKALMVK
jgi:hypothetical protein